MKITPTVAAVERQPVPKIQERAKAELEARVELQRGFVRAIDANKFAGIDLAVKQRDFSRNAFIEMRKFVDRVPSSVGRYSRDRQSSQFGIADAVNNKLRSEPRPGQLAAGFKESKRDQQLDLRAYQNTRIPSIEGARIGREFIKNVENISERSYQRTQQLLEVTKKAIDIIT